MNRWLWMHLLMPRCLKNQYLAFPEHIWSPNHLLSINLQDNHIRQENTSTDTKPKKEKENHEVRWLTQSQKKSSCLGYAAAQDLIETLLWGINVPWQADGPDLHPPIFFFSSFFLIITIIIVIKTSSLMQELCLTCSTVPSTPIGPTVIKHTTPTSTVLWFSSC